MFGSLSLRRLGNNKGGIGYSADQGLLRLTPLPHGTSAMCNGGIGYSADHGLLRLTPLPHGTSAMCNKKAVQCTAVFVVRATICEQVPIVPLTTKATLSSGFLVAHCSRDPGGI